MSISLAIQQRLERVDLIGLYNEHETDWNMMAAKAHKFIEDNFPADYDVHPEDVCKALMPLMEVNDRVNDFINAKRLREKYWMKYFCDYILDQCWISIHH